VQPELLVHRALVEGVACALGAGLLWGLVFVVPLMLPDYPPAMLSFGRYLGFGIIALLLAWTDLPRLQQLQRQDWRMACELALVGNLLYYLFLSAAIQLAGAPLPTMLIGTLPIGHCACRQLRCRSPTLASPAAFAGGDRERHRAGEPA
jgi:drug/metabolite transporter (DMT)-like permease